MTTGTYEPLGLVQITTPTGTRLYEPPFGETCLIYVNFLPNSGYEGVLTAQCQPDGTFKVTGVQDTGDANVDNDLISRVYTIDDGVLRQVEG